MKSLFLTLLAGISPYNGPAQEKPLAKIAPKDVVFCWDIHNTLLKYDLESRLFFEKLEAKHMKKLEAEHPRAHLFAQQAIKTSLLKAQTSKKLLDRSEHYKNKAKASSDPVKSKQYASTAERLKIIGEIFAIKDLMYKPRTEIIALIQTLKSLGYTEHRIASNIEEDNYKKLKKLYPKIFNPSMVQDGVVVNSKAKTIVKKPHPLFYNKMQKTINPTGKKTLVFIDDLKKNKNTAQDNGMIGITMHNTKSLIRKLQKKGINIPIKEKDKKAE